MKRTYIYLALGIVSLLALEACNDGGGHSSTFNSIFNASANSEPSAVSDGDAGAVSLTTEPNPV